MLGVVQFSARRWRGRICKSLIAEVREGAVYIDVPVQPQHARRANALENEVCRCLQANGVRKILVAGEGGLSLSGLPRADPSGFVLLRACDLIEGFYRLCAQPPSTSSAMLRAPRINRFTGEMLMTIARHAATVCLETSDPRAADVCARIYAQSGLPVIVAPSINPPPGCRVFVFVTGYPWFRVLSGDSGEAVASGYMVVLPQKMHPPFGLELSDEVLAGAVWDACRPAALARAQVTPRLCGVPAE